MTKPNADYDELLVKVSGMALLTVALVWLPEAIGAAVHLIGIMLSHPSFELSDGQMKEWLETTRTALIASSLGKVAAFAFLVGLSRWMFGFPPIIRRALARTRRNAMEQETDVTILPP